MVKLSNGTCTHFDPWRDWLTEDVYDRLLSRAMRRFRNDPILAEEAFGFALERLAEDQWRRLRSYRGDAPPAAFLSTVFSRLLEDFSTRCFGRRRPPVVVSRELGELGERIFELLCVRQLPSEAIVDRLAGSGEFRAMEIRNAIAHIKSLVPHCQSVCSARHFDERAFDRTVDVGSLPDNAGRCMQAEFWGCLLRAVLERGKGPDFSDCAVFELDLSEIPAAFSLEEHERRLLEMRYIDNLSFGAIARVEQARCGADGNVRSLETKLRRRHDRILIRWRQLLMAQGLDHLTFGTAAAGAG